MKNLSLKTSLKIYDSFSFSRQTSGDEERTTTNSEKASVNSTYTPHPLVTISNDFGVEYYRNKEDTGSKTDVMNWTLDTDATYRPTPIWEFRGSLYHRATKNNLNGDERPRDKFGLKAIYKVFTWGDIVYDWSLEENKGEILAGSYTIQDYSKTSHSLGLNFRVPQDNIILENIEIRARFKLMSFNNKLNTSENFDASLLSIEGTLNF